MATLAIAGAGAVAGNFLGVGASWGWIAGSLLASYLFPQKGPSITQEGPRLGDLSVSSSAYGAPIAINYGTIRVGGNVIWSSGIREERTSSTQRQGGKGGGSRATTTTITYTYYASFALAFGEGPAGDVLRIWADSKLIFDKTGSGAQAVAVPGLRFRFYPGNETQLPDPSIEAHVGAGNAPAHRGLCYIVFDDLALANFGNRIPNITAEITYNKATSRPFTNAALLSGGISEFQINEIVVDSRRGYAYLRLLGTGGGIRRINTHTMQEDRQVLNADIITGDSDNMSGGIWATDFSGNIYSCTTSANRRPIIKIDPNSLKEVGRFGTSSTALVNSINGFVASEYMAPILVQTLQGQEQYLLFGSIQNDLGILDSNMNYVWGDPSFEKTEIDETLVRGVIAGDIGEAWVLGGAFTGTAPIGIYRIRLSAGAAFIPIPGGGGESIGIEYDKLDTITQADIGRAPTDSMRPLCMVYDQNDGGILFTIRVFVGGLFNAAYVVKWNDGLQWVTPVAVGQVFDEGHTWSVLRGPRYCYVAANRVFQIDTRTGELVSDDPNWSGVNQNGVQFYNSVDDTILAVRQTPSTLVKLFLNRGAGLGDTLSAIVADLCERAGLAFGDINVAELTDTVLGYSVGRQSSVRAAIEPLSTAFFFDGVESDYVLKFPKRGRTPLLAIPQEALAPLQGSEEYWREARLQEVELPVRLNAAYIEKETDYQQGLQPARRVSAPVPTMYSKNEVTMTLPIVLQATNAQRIAEALLYTAWLERDRYEGVLPWTYLLLDPTDVIHVDLDDGTRFTVRLSTTNIGLEFPIEINGLSEDAATYQSSVVANPGAGFPVQTLPTDAPVELFLLDVPLLRDQDSLTGLSRLYFAVGAHGVGDFVGGILYKSSDGVQYVNAATTLQDATWGVTLNVLSAPPSPWRTDESSFIDVAISRGEEELESVSQLEMLNGANGALVGQELVQFRDVEELSAGRYRLTGLLRGRRGTEQYAFTHGTGERFLLLTPDTVRSIALSLDEVGATRLYRGVRYGELFEEAAEQALASTAADLKPYAPAHLFAEYVSNDIEFSWVRRTRLGGGLRDGTGTVPLAEVTEAYEVDVLDAPNGNVLRTLSSTSPDVTYAEADILTDFGSLPSSISFSVYQLSESVGRGFRATATLEV